MRRAAILGVAMLAGTAGPAAAFGTQSVPTELKLDACTVASTNDLETVWACPGYKGIPVMVRKAQTRATLSFGLTSTTERAANELLPRGWAPAPEIGWRLSNRGGRWTAFATIVHFTAADSAAGDVLVVTRLGAGTTCQIAFVDAKANADAGALAEQAADAHGFDFDCARDTPAKMGPFKAW